MKINRLLEQVQEQDPLKNTHENLLTLKLVRYFFYGSGLLGSKKYIFVYQKEEGVRM